MPGRAERQERAALERCDFSGAPGWHWHVLSPGHPGSSGGGHMKSGFAVCFMHSTWAHAVALWAGPLGLTIELEKPGGEGCSEGTVCSEGT